MSSTTLFEELKAIPFSERTDWLVDYLACKFKPLLFLDALDDLPLDQNYFDLGLTSLAIEELKHGLEEDFGMAVNPAVLFNNPTVDQLLNYLRRELLAEYFILHGEDVNTEGDRAPCTQVVSDNDYAEREILEGMLDSLYRRS
ncbi:MAG: acyl carrier protein [Pseudomonadota bacterium]